MTYREMKEKVERIYNEAKEEFKFVGLRLENKEREVGDICGKSKHNPNRDDSRDFPEYGSQEYKKLPEFDGTSSWDCRKVVNNFDSMVKGQFVDWEDEVLFERNHAYIIAGNEVDNHIDRDYDEIIIKKAEVIAIIF